MSKTRIVDWCTRPIDVRDDYGIVHLQHDTDRDKTQCGTTIGDDWMVYRADVDTDVWEDAGCKRCTKSRYPNTVQV